MASKVFPSPNHGPRRGGKGHGPRRPDMLILHYTGMADSGEALLRLCNQAAEVSSHYLVFEDGCVLQLVPESRRAWHAGRGHWAGEDDINSCSIGVEIAHPGHEGGLPPWPRAQIAATIALCRDICARHAIGPARVLAHSDIAPERKQDPGETFDWQALAAAGIGLWTPPAPVRGGRYLARGDTGQPVEALQTMFAHLGYGIETDGIFGPQTEAVTRAFQRHWRQQRVDGVADVSTITTLRDLLRRLAD